MRIEQVYMSECIAHFHEGFRKLHGLREYDNPNEPSLFVGMYNIQDFQALKSHQARTLVMFSGADMVNAPMVRSEIVADSYMAGQLNTLESIKIANVSYRDFSEFKTVPLGEKIYCYQNGDSDGNRHKYKRYLLNKVIERYGTRVVIGYHPHTDEEMRQIYSECAIGLQFNPMAGYTSTKELAHMGRMSLSNRPAPFTRKFTEQNLLSEIDYLLENTVTEEFVSLRAKKFVNIGDNWLR